MIATIITIAMVVAPPAIASTVIVGADPTWRTAAPAGSSLVEVMVGLLLGTLATGAAVTTFHTMRTAYVIAAEQRELEQRGGALLETIATLLRHAGWHPAPTAALPPPLIGRDDCGQPALGDALNCGKPGIAGSDALWIRFGGDHPFGDPAMPDRYLSDCSGYPVAVTVPGAATAPASSPRVAGYLSAHLLYVADGADGEPQLLCRYPGRADGGTANNTWNSGALARGVETLQLRYGVDRDGDGRVDTVMRASELNIDGPAAWRKVLAVQIALVLRTGAGVAGSPASPLALLPARTAGEQGDDIAFVPRTRPAASRRVFATTVWLRNAPFCAASSC
ncbi:PilW family protein [Cupriavidus gilardii]|uniref:PilW family protein n=1 Tax=Cupriavidus gilardii TaxID=82541 RepID=UPI001FC98118|nr:PilW family protein [Cupriavidus gilardii]